MKQKYLYMLAIAFICCIQAKAQKVLLPFGQFTLQPWTATYFYAPIGGETPPDNWYATDFDDSEWGTLEGPISTSNGLFRATTWDRNSNSRYWLRRHFTIDDINDISERPFVTLYLLHDDGCNIYLNNTLIYTNGNYLTNLVSINMTDEMQSLFVKGDNVIAVTVSDVTGEGFIDFGIEANNAPPLTNPHFLNGTAGWTCTGKTISTGGPNNNNVVCFRSNNPFDIHQTIKGTRRGLYRIYAQAFEACNDWDSECEHFSNIPVSAYLYANDTRHVVKNVFNEAVSTNIYNSDDYYITSDKTYVPTTINGASIAFQNGMYENEFYAYIDTTDFDIGIAMSEQAEKTRWTVFDNFRIEFFGERALDKQIEELETLSKQNMENSIKPKCSLLLAKLKAANGYESKGRLLAEYSDDYVSARNSVEQYKLIKRTVDILQNRLNTGVNMSDNAKAEAKDLIATTNTRLAESSISSSEVISLMDKLEEMNKRLNYMYLDFTITVPGSLGDSILSKVENFVDVQSLKLSGTLNDEDFGTIQNRLSQLREIDMTNVKMTSLPNKLFYGHSLLERVEFPTGLTQIGEYAFYKCSELRQIDFPETLTEICQYAFAYCDNILEVILPEGLTTLRNDAFSMCKNNCFTKLPSSLSRLNYATFWSNVRLKKIEFEEGLTHIESKAFYNCYELDNLKFPKSLYFIGTEAFAYNRTLSNIEFNEGLFQIADNAFYDCDALTEITLPSSLVLANASPFDYCDNLKKVTCLSMEPPYMTDQIPLGVSMEGRELYVPALSINAYKQTVGWDKFLVIKPIDYLPENIAVRTELHLTLSENIPAHYKPNVDMLHAIDTQHDSQYGCLIVNGTGTLSMSNYTMLWDPNSQFYYYNRNLNYSSLVNNSHLRADNVFIKFNLRNNVWTFLTLPFDVQLSDISTIADGTTNWVVRKYDSQKRASGETSETWVKMTGDDIINAGEGFIIQSSRFLESSLQDYSTFLMKAINNTNKNNIFRTDNITVTLNEYQSEFAHNRSWNFIGNPYPCYYDTRFMDFEAPITVWNMRNSTYSAYSPIDDSYILCPGEAFFVQRPIEKGAIVFNKEGRQTNRDARILEASARRIKPDISTRIIVNLSLSDGNNTDHTRIVLNDKATMQYELDKDANKFMSTDTSVPQIFTSANGVNYAINERPLADGVVDLSTYFGADGIYTITLANHVNGYKVILEDKEENKRVVLAEGSSYVFSAKAKSGNSRFAVYFSCETTGVEDIRSDEKGNTSIYTIEGIKMSTPTKRGLYIKNGKKLMLNK